MGEQAEPGYNTRGRGGGVGEWDRLTEGASSKQNLEASGIF